MERPDNFEENRQVVNWGHKVADIARQTPESESGACVITSQNAIQLYRIITGTIKTISASEPDKPLAEEAKQKNITVKVWHRTFAVPDFFHVLLVVMLVYSCGGSHIISQNEKTNERPRFIGKGK